MSFGSVLIGLALAMVVGVWLAQPFRRAAAPDWAIEYWVAQTRAAARREPLAVGREGETGTAPEEEVNFCPRCGRRAGPEDRFCARCGAPLRP